MKRRDFLKLTAAGGALLAADAAVPRARAATAPLPPGAVGLLYDATLCIGCKSCMVGCKKENSRPGGALWSEGMTAPPYELDEGGLHDAATELSGRTLTVIQGWKNGTAAAKDAPVNGFSWVKRQCLHCAHPACVSACPVSALRKDRETGVVTYDKDACIGCRYCQIACPFGIPQFEWDQAFPQIRKCQLCVHLIEAGGYAACAGYCPTGATVYGPTAELLAEARRRVALEPGASFDYPLQTLAGRRVEGVAAAYEPGVYGASEVGGTQCLVLAGVPFDRLGLPELPEGSFAAKAEGIQHTLYKGMIAPGVVLAGLLWAAYKNTRDEG